MAVVFIILLTAGIALLAYALGVLIYELILVFSNKDGEALSRYTQPHIFWRAVLLGAALISAAFIVKLYQFLL